MFFVLSSGRSGSRTASEVFSQYENCLCLHHPRPELVVEATQYYYGNDDGREIARILRETRQPVVDGKIYGEVNLQLTLLVPILREVFPHAKYIWLMRDGREVVASMYYRGWYDRSQTRVPEYWHDARLQADQTGDISSDEWNRHTRFEKCCWLWTKYNLIIEGELAATDPGPWRQVKLEEMKVQLPAIESFLGLHKTKPILVRKRNVALQPVVSWHEWDTDQRQSFERICGEAMDKWYPTWRDRQGQWAVVASEAPDTIPWSETVWNKFKAAVRRTRRVIKRTS